MLPWKHKIITIIQLPYLKPRLLKIVANIDITSFMVGQIEKTNLFVNAFILNYEVSVKELGIAPVSVSNNSSDT